MVLYAELAACKENCTSVDSSEAQALVAKLHAYTTSNFYTCTDEILAGLGQMYIDDVHFKKNIDMHGEGTAKFASEAIADFCQEK